MAEPELACCLDHTHIISLLPSCPKWVWTAHLLQNIKANICNCLRFLSLHFAGLVFRWTAIYPQRKHHVQIIDCSGIYRTKIDIIHFLPADFQCRLQSDLDPCSYTFWSTASVCYFAVLNKHEQDRSCWFGAWSSRWWRWWSESRLGRARWSLLRPGGCPGPPGGTHNQTPYHAPVMARPLPRPQPADLAAGVRDKHPLQIQDWRSDTWKTFYAYYRN